MKINFTGHSPTEREVEISQDEIKLIFDLMKRQFLDHLEYTSAFERESSYESYVNAKVRALCKSNDVDVSYTPDRISFFDAILEKMEWK
jgi:hypothetical protein